MTLYTSPDVLAERRGAAGLISLNRPKALNALSLDMIRALTAQLLAWRDDPAIASVALRGMGREGPFGAFCAGGDIRFFHQAALAGDPRLEDFFTEEYTLDHLIARYPKPVVAFMDGIVMGGGMGLGQFATLRAVTARTQIAMPETGIGLFPDVGGSHFLSRTPGHTGEYLALTGRTIGGAEAIACGLADVWVDVEQLEGLWAYPSPEAVRARAVPPPAVDAHWPAQAEIDAVFGLKTVRDIVAALASLDAPWAQQARTLLAKRSPLMLHVALEQVRRGRTMALADCLRMERGLIRHVFHLRPGAAGEGAEGIRALAVDKDHTPKWNPAAVADVTDDMVAAFFADVWPANANPLAGLRD